METQQKIDKSQINRVVWKACDTFRGVIDPSQYKDYVLTMLFLKYLSDVYKAKYTSYLERYEGDRERAARSMRRERFVVPETSSFDYLYQHRTADNIGELIDIALADIEDANRGKMSSEDGGSIFRNISFNSANLGEPKEKNARLKNLLADYNELTLDESHLENSDVIGEAYMFLIEKFASDAGKKAGEFFTPAEVSTLLARLTKSKPGARICDPACGSGSLLIKAGKEVGGNNFSLYGQEVNGSTWALAMMNMFLHGYDNAVIRWGDTLRNPKLKEDDRLMKFDTVVANPPFSLDKWGADEAAHDPYNRFWRGVPPKSKGDWAFISLISAYSSAGRARARYAGRSSTRICWKPLSGSPPTSSTGQVSRPPLPSSTKGRRPTTCSLSMPAANLRTARTKIGCAPMTSTTSSPSIGNSLPGNSSPGSSRSDMPLWLPRPIFRKTTTTSIYPAMSIPSKRRPRLIFRPCSAK